MPSLAELTDCLRLNGPDDRVEYFASKLRRSGTNRNDSEKTATQTSQHTATQLSTRRDEDSGDERHARPAQKPKRPSYGRVATSTMTAFRLNRSESRGGPGGGSKGPGHKVSFSGSSKSSKDRDDSANPSASDSSRPGTPANREASKQDVTLLDDNSNSWQRINRQNEALWQESIPSPEALQPRPFLVYSDTFLSLLGPRPSLSILIEDSRAPFFHHACVYVPYHSTLFLTSAPISDSAPDAAPSRNKSITITKVDFYSPTDFSRDKVRPPPGHNYMPSSGCSFRDGLLLLAQGTLAEPSAILYMSAKRPHTITTLLNNYHGRAFNSPHSVAVLPSDNSIWFTDPIYGYERGFRPRPQLPNQVYRFEPSTGDIRVVADGFGRPSGICFSPDESTCYISDCDFVHGEGTGGRTPDSNQPASLTSTWRQGEMLPGRAPTNSSSSRSSRGRDNTLDPLRPATIYAYSITYPSPAHPRSPFLTNRRVFAYPDSGIPSAITCDAAGNVYAACGDGVNVWNAGGVLLGKVLIEGGCKGLGWGRSAQGLRELWVCGGRRLWRVEFGGMTTAGMGAGLGRINKEFR